MTDKKVPVIGIKFTNPAIWLGVHWQTYQQGQADYVKLAKDQNRLPDMIARQYQGVRALINAGYVQMQMTDPLPDDATDEEKDAYKGVETMLQAIREFVRSDVNAAAPLVIQATLARAVADDLEEEISRPLDFYLSGSFGISAMVNVSSSRRS